MLALSSDCSWNSLIFKYVAGGEPRRALLLYKQMRQQSLFPSEFSYLGLLKSCIKLNDPNRGREIHADISSRGWLKTNLYLGNMLVDMYAKFGSLVKAQEVFDLLPRRNVVTWTTLIAGYAQSDQSQEALHFFNRMQAHGIFPNAHTYACILKCCGNSGEVNSGLEFHAEVVRRMLLQTSEVLGCTLVDMYSKWGLLAKAQEVFDTLSSRDVATWTALIAGYAQHELGVEALKCLQQMKLEGPPPNSITYSSCVKACGSIKAHNLGVELHAEVSRKGLLEKDPVLGSAFVDMYVKCGLLQKAEEVFDRLAVRDAVSWNALIAGYLHHEHSEEALWCFEEMQSSNVSPDAATFVFALKACSNTKNLIRGKEIHAKISKKGLLERHLVLGNALIAMYATCGMLAKAEEVFDELLARDVVSWTALLSGLIEHNFSVDALRNFKQMIQEAILPDVFIFTCCLKACGISGATRKGIEIHSQIAQKELVQNDNCVGNALLAMYAQVGMLHRAREVFDELQVQDVFSWTQLIAGYVEHNLCEEAIDCYRKMQEKGVLSDSVTFTHLLKACGKAGDADFGKELHSKIQGNERVKGDPFLNSALVDMYAKCGMLTKAQEVFDSKQFHDNVAWTALLTCYAQQGQTDNVVRILDKMREGGKKPSLVTFVSVLNACSHAGFVEKGVVYLEVMVNEYGITPTLEHYTCMIDLLCRAGQVEKALELLKQTSLDPDIELWLTVLGSCQKWGNVDLGRDAFKEVLLLDDKRTSAYICMYNIFAQAAMHEDALQVEALRIKNHALKRPE